MAILVALASLHTEHHTLAVDIRHLQRDDFRNAQAGTIGDAERSLVFDAGRRLQQARDFFGAEDDRQFARLVDERQRLLWRYLLIWPESDRPEYQSSWRGLLAQRLQGSTPAEIVGEIFSGDAMEATHPFL